MNQATTHFHHLQKLQPASAEAGVSTLFTENAILIAMFMLFFSRNINASITRDIMKNQPISGPRNRFSNVMMGGLVGYEPWVLPKGGEGHVTLQPPHPFGIFTAAALASAPATGRQQCTVQEPRSQIQCYQKELSPFLLLKSQSLTGHSPDRPSLCHLPLWHRTACCCSCTAPAQMCSWPAVPLTRVDCAPFHEIVLC